MESSQIHAARKRARKLSLADNPRTILLCMDCKTAKCASDKQMMESWKFLKRRLKELQRENGLGVMRIKMQCVGVCVGGPIAVVMPDGVWYGGCTPEVLEQILTRHVVGGNPVSEFVIAEPKTE